MDGSTPEWTTVVSLSGSRLGPEVSYKQFKLRLPKELRLDLQSSEANSTGLVWNGLNNPGLRLSIYTQPRKDRRQLTPLITEAAQDAHVAEQLLVINRPNLTVKRGQIQDTVFTEIEGAAEVQGETLTQYIAPFDADWLFVEFMAPNHSEYARVLRAAACTVRLAEPGEQRVDPFGPGQIAPRLVEDYHTIAAFLRAQGPAGEDAVAGLLQAKDRALRESAITLLMEIATERSLPAIRRAATDADPIVVEHARTVLLRLQPGDSAQGPRPAVGPGGAEKDSDPATILADLDNKDPVRRNAAVAKLSGLTPDDKQRAMVTAKLIGMLQAGDNAVPIPDIVGALQVWGDAKMVPDLLPFLKLGGNPDIRHAAMRLLGPFKDGRAVIPVANWIVLDPVPTADSLIAMGPIAEDAVIRMLHDANAAVRIDAARILARIGTKKCLSDLDKAAHDPHDQAARGAAISAAETVKARAEAEPPGK